MGEASRRNLRVIDGGKRRLPAGPPVRLRQVALLVPSDVMTDIELRQSLVAEHYQSQGDFLLALLKAGMDKFDSELQAEQDRQASARAAQEQMRRHGPGEACDESGCIPSMDHADEAAPPVSYAPYETHHDEGGEG